MMEKIENYIDQDIGPLQHLIMIPNNEGNASRMSMAHITFSSSRSSAGDLLNMSPFIPSCKTSIMPSASLPSASRLDLVSPPNPASLPTAVSIPIPASLHNDSIW